MNNFFYVIVWLRLSVATAVNFTQVFEWPDEMDYEWPSEASRTQALKDGTFRPKNIKPHSMAVYGSRIFLSLEKFDGIPVTLVSLPTSSESSASPKLTPFPSFDMHRKGDCYKIEEAKGLQVDAVGRLWVLDSGSYNCYPKIWNIDLLNNDQTKLIHQFTFYGSMQDLTIDEAPNGTFAYISQLRRKNVVVFSLERNASWVVDTPGIEFTSIALSPKKEPRQLYLAKSYFNEVYSISVATLRNGTQTANPKLIGKWTAIQPFRMLFDDHGTTYAAFWGNNYILSWNNFQSFQEWCFHEVGEPIYSFALDSSGTLWITVFSHTANKYRCRLLKAAVGANYENAGKRQADESTNCSALIGSLAFFLVLSCIIIIWFILRMRKLQKSLEQRDAGAVEMQTLPNPVSPEMVHDEIENDLYGVVTAPPTRARF